MIILAKTFQGLEEILAEEIRSLGGKNVQPLKRAVQFEGDRRVLYKVNLQAATALRVLVFLFEYKFYNQDSYYDSIHRFEWERYLSKEQSFAIDAVVSSNAFPHTRMAIYKAKDAIVDRFRRRKGQRPDVQLEGEDLRIHCFIKANHARIYLDSSGTSLHLRGYKKRIGKAPLNEVLAAGLIRLSGWDGTGPFVDPMCGSGTIPIEAALFATHTPVNRLRSFGFMKWLDYRPALWTEVFMEAQQGIVNLDVPIFGGDKEARMVIASKQNAERAGMSEHIRFVEKYMDNWDMEDNKGVLVFNPPFDKRLKEADINRFYSDIGDTLKQKWSGYTAWMITGNMGALKKVGLKASRRIPLYNGPIESRFVRYELYKGSR